MQSVQSLQVKSHLTQRKETEVLIWQIIKICGVMQMLFIWSPLEEAVKSISSSAFNHPQLRFQDSRRETRRFQGGFTIQAVLEHPGFSPGVLKTELRVVEWGWWNGLNSFFQRTPDYQSSLYNIELCTQFNVLWLMTMIHLCVSNITYSN
jgi:hypothetical protein